MHRSDDEQSDGTATCFTTLHKLKRIATIFTYNYVHIIYALVQRFSIHQRGGTEQQFLHLCVIL